MKSDHPDRLVFDKEFTKQEPIPQEGINKAVEIMKSGRLHRYNTAVGEISEVALLEREYAAHVGSKFCAAFNSCGSSIYVGLKSVGVKAGDRVLCNAFTLAPVPGAIENAGARTVFVQITPDYTVDLDDLVRKAEESRAKYFLLSHMRGHIADMDQVCAICKHYGICLIEDCAHTVGCGWGNRNSGTFGQVGCFSTQTYKHLNSGEGGLLVTDDEEVIARAILYSGSYMLYETHLSRPSLKIFERYQKIIPNFSLRMSNLQAALLRPQLKSLGKQCERWNKRYAALEAGLNEIDHIHVPKRHEKERYGGSSIQFTIDGVPKNRVSLFLEECGRRGVAIKWFGWKEPVGFTSSYESWQYIAELPVLEQTRNILDFMCDMRIPLTFSTEDCQLIAAVIKQVAIEIFR